MITFHTWANTREQAEKLQAAGWIADPKQPIILHHSHAILLTFTGDAAEAARSLVDAGGEGERS